jgi:hypothetical protein
MGTWNWDGYCSCRNDHRRAWYILVRMVLNMTYSSLTTRPISLFKFLLRQRGSRYEEKNIRYAVLARVIRDGGLKVAIIARWSIIPPHSEYASLLWKAQADIGVSADCSILNLRHDAADIPHRVRLVAPEPVRERLPRIRCSSRGRRL